MSKKKEAKLNIQGLARRRKDLLSCIKPEDGCTTVSIDLASGEPTVTAHYTQDPNYMYATINGVGKPPYYSGTTLMIDDIYLMGMSASPIGKDYLWDVYNTTFSGKTFQEQWLEDAEVIKDEIKKQRQLHKMLCLAIGYGMGPDKMVSQAYDNGFSISRRDAELFHKAYWRKLFPEIGKFSRSCAMKIKKHGCVVNEFGYRLTPPPHKAYNFVIQSSVSGIMHVYRAKLKAVAPYAKFVTCVHDEFLYDVPDDKVEQFRADRQKACDSLNQDLNWTVAVRVGFAPGKTWYEAK